VTLRPIPLLAPVTRTAFCCAVSTDVNKSRSFVASLLWMTRADPSAVCPAATDVRASAKVIA